MSTTSIVVYLLRFFYIFLFLFFFSSRRRHTRSLCDWSSDVFSSDLERPRGRPRARSRRAANLSRRVAMAQRLSRRAFLELGAVSLAVAGVPAVARGQGGVIRLGTLTPLTGNGGNYGPSMLKAMQWVA